MKSQRSIGNKSTLVWVMAWCQKGNKPLQESRMTNFADAWHIIVTRPQWIKLRPQHVKKSMTDNDACLWLACISGGCLRYSEAIMCEGKGLFTGTGTVQWHTQGVVGNIHVILQAIIIWNHIKHYSIINSSSAETIIFWSVVRLDQYHGCWCHGNARNQVINLTQ